MTELRKIATVADTWGMTMAPHLFPELNVQLLASIPNGIWIEDMGLADDLFVDPVPVVKGMITAPERPGHGLAFKPEILRDCEDLFVDPVPVVKGMITAPERPGHGLEFKPEILRDCAVKNSNDQARPAPGLLFERDLIRKPVSTFRDRALDAEMAMQQFRLGAHRLRRSARPTMWPLLMM